MNTYKDELAGRLSLRLCNLNDGRRSPVFMELGSNRDKLDFLDFTSSSFCRPTTAQKEGGQISTQLSEKNEKLRFMLMPGLYSPLSH